MKARIRCAVYTRKSSEEGSTWRLTRSMRNVKLVRPMC